MPKAKPKKTRNPKLTPEKQIGLLKGTIVFMLNSLTHHGFIDDDQHKHLVNNLKPVGKFFYTIDEFMSDGEDKKEKVF